jgi:hypothetical protein
MNASSITFFNPLAFHSTSFYFHSSSLCSTISFLTTLMIIILWGLIILTKKVPNPTMHEVIIYFQLHITFINVIVAHTTSTTFLNKLEYEWSFWNQYRSTTKSQFIAWNSQISQPPFHVVHASYSQPHN